jgi:hypothetical protein
LRIEAACLARAVANVHITGITVIPFDAHFIEANKLSEPFLYKALSAKIGLLDADVIIAITEFHCHIQEARSRLPLLIRNKDRNYSYSVANVLAPARDAVKNIVPGLRKIEGILSIRERAADPDLGITDHIIEMEELNHQ